MDTAVVYYHKNCPDGFGAAWWLSRFLGRGKDVAYRAVMYGDPVDFKLIDGADVYIVDFCFDVPTLEAIARYARTVLVLDHHKTAAENLPHAKSYRVVDSVDQLDPMFACQAVLDMNRSGTGLAIAYAARRVNDAAPRFLLNIEDRDLWKFELDDTASVFAAVTSWPYDFETWDHIATMLHSDLERQGQAIERYRQNVIKAICDTAYVATVCGHRVWLASAPYSMGSDVAGELAKRTPTLFGAYYVDYGNTVRYGLRSGPEGLDVAELAQTMGGGGHRHAAGFELHREDQ